MTVPYSMPMGLQVFDKEGKRLVDEYIFSMAETRNWTSSTYNSLSELDQLLAYTTSHKIIRPAKGPDQGRPE